MSSAAENELAAFDVDVSHQEIARIMLELENFYATQPTSDAWIPIQGAELWLCQHLGYEDVDEFEDAIKGPFAAFLSKMPQFETMTDSDGKVLFRASCRATGPERPVKMIYKVENTKDLFTVMLKSPSARVEIPEMEFEIGADNRRQVDTIYNYIAAAVYNLGQHLKANHESLPKEHFDKIYATVHMLNTILDVERPFHWVVTDPKGQVSFKPMDKVAVEYTDLETIQEEAEEE